MLAIPGVETGQVDHCCHCTVSIERTGLELPRLAQARPPQESRYWTWLVVTHFILERYLPSYLLHLSPLTDQLLPHRSPPLHIGLTMMKRDISSCSVMILHKQTWFGHTDLLNYTQLPSYQTNSHETSPHFLFGSKITTTCGHKKHYPCALYSLIVMI